MPIFVPRYILAFIFLLLISALFGQNAFQMAFSDSTAQRVEAEDVIATTGGYVVAGRFHGNSSYKPFLMKISEIGELLWYRHYAINEDAENYFNKVIKANDGGYLAVGFARDFLGEMLLVKTDDNGVMQWQKIVPSYNTNRSNNAYSVSAISGGYIVIGFSYKGSNQTALTKIDNQGNTIWSKRYPAISGIYPPIMYDCSISNDTIYAGGFKDTLTAFSRFDINGSPISTVLFKGLSNGQMPFYHMAPTADGDFILSGTTLLPDSIPNTYPGHVPWICRVSSAGELRWSKVYSELYSGSYGTSRVAALSDGNFLLAPYYIDSETSTGLPSGNPALMKINGNGEVVWSYQYGLSGKTDLFRSVTETPDGGILAVGTVNLPDSASSQRSILIVKTDANGLVTNCCKKPIAAKAFDYAVELSTITMNQTTFDNTINYNAPNDTSILTPLNYCPPLSRQREIHLCPGDSIVIDGIAYDSAGQVLSTVSGPQCDTLFTYTIKTDSNPTYDQTILFCPGDTVFLYGNAYTQPTTFTQAIPSATGRCDTLVNFTLELLAPPPTLRDTLHFCPGTSVTLGDSTYTQPTTVALTLPSTTGGCDTLHIYTLVADPQPTRSDTLRFCPGATLLLGDSTYTQPTTVTLTLPALTGCDTLAQYTLAYFPLPQPSQVSLACPPNASVQTAAPTDFSVPFDYDLPTAVSTCICGDNSADLSLTQGLPTGSNFGIGINTICYTATDACGNSASCCFTVTVSTLPSDEPCDTKPIGCLTFDLLGISADAAQNRTYRIRVTNDCTGPLVYAAFEVPGGVMALAPGNDAIYTAPSGRPYLVRDPNISPFYSIRFKSTTDSIAGGESDLFQYTLPNEAALTYIHVIARVAPQTFYEAYLNVFNCPISGGAKPGTRRSLAPASDTRSIYLYPNPTSGNVFADLSAWAGEAVRLRVLDGQGREVWTGRTVAGLDAFAIPLGEAVSSGLYFFEAWAEERGTRGRARFVVER